MSRIWAVARHMIAESIRTKVALVFIILILVILGTTPFLVTGDGLTLKSRVQNYLAYSLGSIGVLLSFLTVFVSCGTLNSEIQQKQIFMVVSKPIPRWQFFLGKWLGVVALNAALLLLTFAAVTVSTWYLKNRPTTVPGDARALQEEVLSVRHNFKLRQPDWGQVARERIRQLREQGKIDALSGEGEVSLMKRIVDEEKRGWRTLPPRQWRTFEFRDLMVSKTGVEDDRGSGMISENVVADAAKKWSPNRWAGYTCVIQNTLYPIITNGASTLTVLGVPPAGKQDYSIQHGGTLFLRIKPRHPSGTEDAVLAAVFVCGDTNEPDTLTREVPGEYVAERFHSLPIPTFAVNSRNTLYVHVYNLSEQDSITFEGDESFELLYSLGTFHWNTFRAIVIIWCRISFLAALGLMLSTFLSFPVACMAGFLALGVASARVFLSDSLEWTTSGPSREDMLWILGPALRLMAKTFVGLLPDFAAFDAVSNVVGGRLVTLVWVLHALGILVLFQAAAMMVVGCTVLTKRELAKATS